METLPKSLVVGSANFGAKYGAKNCQVSRPDAFKIIQEVSKRDDVFIESSESYPGAEKIIGEALGTKKFEKIIIKISPNSFSSESSFIEAVENSLCNLNQSKVYAVMLHGVGDSLGKSKSAIQAGISKILHEGLSEKVGVSCYSISEVIETKAAFPGLGIYQLPENIVDTRKYSSKELRELSAAGVIFQVRSIFLQGLLLDARLTLDSRFQETEKLQREIKTLAESQDMDSAELCLRYALSIDWASQFVLGLESYENFQRNLEIMENVRPDVSFEVAQGSDFLVDPRNWS
jgi:aryl-alcohol dehydrogenase-like predicted oxidoreductase